MEKDGKTEIVKVTPQGGEAITVRVRSSDSRTAEKMLRLFKNRCMKRCGAGSLAEFIFQATPRPVKSWGTRLVRRFSTNQKFKRTSEQSGRRLRRSKSRRRLELISEFNVPFCERLTAVAH